MMCATCGKPVEPTAAYCSACGALLTEAATGPTQRLSSSPSEQHAQERLTSASESANIRDGLCPRCGSRDIIPNYPIRDHTYGQIVELEVQATEKPDALVFKGDSCTSYIRAWMCGQCGYTELYITHPQDFFHMYMRQQG